MERKLLFLDDIRNPEDCVKYMWGKGVEVYRISSDSWNIVRSYKDFVEFIETNGVPDFISFDHDLSDEHYSSEMYNGGENYNELYKTFREKTGYDCAKWLTDYCVTNCLPFPDYRVHSMNPVGRDNIKNLLDSYKKFEERMC